MASKIRQAGKKAASSQAKNMSPMKRKSNSDTARFALMPSMEHFTKSKLYFCVNPEGHMFLGGNAAYNLVESLGMSDFYSVAQQYTLDPKEFKYPNGDPYPYKSMKGYEIMETSLGAKQMFFVIISSAILGYGGLVVVQAGLLTATNSSFMDDKDFDLDTIDTCKFELPNTLEIKPALELIGSTVVTQDLAVDASFFKQFASFRSQLFLNNKSESYIAAYDAVKGSASYTGMFEGQEKRIKISATEFKTITEYSPFLPFKGVSLFSYFLSLSPDE